MINATIPFELSILANRKQFPVAIAMNTLMASIAGVLAPMILAGLHIEAGYPSFIAGIVLSLATAVLLLVVRLGAHIEKQQTKKPEAQASV